MTHTTVADSRPTTKLNTTSSHALCATISLLVVCLVSGCSTSLASLPTPSNAMTGQPERHPVLSLFPHVDRERPGSEIRHDIVQRQAVAPGVGLTSVTIDFSLVDRLPDELTIQLLNQQEQILEEVSWTGIRQGRLPSQKHLSWMPHKPKRAVVVRVAFKSGPFKRTYDRPAHAGENTIVL